MPSFANEEFYKDSILTYNILNVLDKTVKLDNLKDDLKKQIKNEKSAKSYERAEFLLALTGLERIDSVKSLLNNLDAKTLDYFKIRVDQLIFNLSDIIVRFSPLLIKFIFTFINQNNMVNFKYYCKICLSFIADNGGIPINTNLLRDKFTK